MRGKARVSESDIKEMMREIRMALLEADVNYGVVKEFVADMTEKCKGADVQESFTPGQQIVKIVRDSLTELLGGEEGEEKLGLLQLFEKQQAKAKKALEHLKGGDNAMAAKELEELIEEM